MRAEQLQLTLTVEAQGSVWTAGSVGKGMPAVPLGERLPQELWGAAPPLRSHKLGKQHRAVCRADVAPGGQGCVGGRLSVQPPTND